MEIIPAIDIMSGKCARLIRGDYATKKIYNGDPLRIALAFQNAGIKKLHLVDLDGAKEGKVKNWKTIEKLATFTDLALQAGGGFRTQEDIQRLLRFGPHEVSLGTIALETPQKLKKFLKKFGNEKIVVDVAVKKGKIHTKGWQKKTKENLIPFLNTFTDLGVKTIICTDISRDGTLKGPNFFLYQTLIKKFPNLRIIASGGITTMRDVRKLSKIGVAGAIIGKAIYEKKISLKDLNPFLIPSRNQGSAGGRFL